MSIREAFEAWWEINYHNGNPPRFGWAAWRDGDGYKIDDDESELDGMWNAWQAATNAMEAKCAALAAELSQAKSVVSECREYFIAGIMNRIRPTNEGYLHMRCDTLGDETPSHDTFLAEVRAQGADECVRQLVISDDDDFSDAPNICAMVAHQFRQEAAQ